MDGIGLYWYFYLMDKDKIYYFWMIRMCGNLIFVNIVYIVLYVY